MYKIIGADGNQYGPVPVEELKNWLRDRRANGETLVQPEGGTEWRPLRDYPEFRDVLGAPQALPSGVPVAGGAMYPSVGGPEAAASQVGGPGIGMVVLGSLVILANLLSMLANMFGMLAQQSFGDPQLDRALNALSGGIGIITCIVGMAFGIMTIIAGIQMQKLKSYGFVLVMAILNIVLPCCSGCCFTICIGLPISIWCLVVLMRPDVKSAFK